MNRVVSWWTKNFQSTWGECNVSRYCVVFMYVPFTYLTTSYYPLYNYNSCLTYNWSDTACRWRRVRGRQPNARRARCLSPQPGGAPGNRRMTKRLHWRRCRPADRAFVSIEFADWKATHYVKHCKHCKQGNMKRLVMTTELKLNATRFSNFYIY